MATTFAWQISDCDHVVADGGINRAHWSCTASETVGSGDDEVTYSAYQYGAQGLTYDASASGFIPYADVTEQNVLDWIWANGVDKAANESSLQTQIDAQKNPVEENGTPWAS